jgi:hypothetical protein
MYCDVPEEDNVRMRITRGFVTPGLASLITTDQSHISVFNQMRPRIVLKC